MTAIIAESAVFYGFMVLQRIIELITAEGGGQATRDVAIAGAPFYRREGGQGFVFSGGSEYATFRLVATLTVDPEGAGDEVLLGFGREELFDELHNPYEPPMQAFEYTHRDITANDLSKVHCPLQLTLQAEALPLVAWIIYSLFVEYHVNVDALEEDHAS